MYPDAGAMTPERLDYLRKDLGRFKIEYGGETRPEVVEKRFNPQGNSIWDLAGSVGTKLAIEPLEAAVRVGDALRGKSEYVVDEINDPKTVSAAMVRDVMDASGAVATPGILTGKPGATTVGLFAGKGAKNAPVRMRDIAEKALAAGKDPDEVWKYTGWKKGMEGEWRFEIDDRAMKFTPEAQASFTEQKGMQGLFKAGDDLREGVPLPKAIDHPALFKQYPELEGVTLKADHPKGGGASFDESTMTIHVPKEAVMLGQQNSYLDSITHEIQHWVQKKEGFARGTSIEHEFSKAWNDFKNYDSNISKASLTEASNKFAHRRYENSAGEIEARAAAARRTWDTEMRRAVPPDMRKDAIVRMK
jgi:hypothetical protein